jgi:hypothetical protein
VTPSWKTRILESFLRQMIGIVGQSPQKMFFDGCTFFNLACQPASEGTRVASSLRVHGKKFVHVPVRKWRLHLTLVRCVRVGAYQWLSSIIALRQSKGATVTLELHFSVCQSASCWLSSLTHSPDKPVIVEVNSRNSAAEVCMSSAAPRPSLAGGDM